MLAVRPYSTSFASRIASSTSEALCTASTGPKTSSRASRLPGFTSSKTVGATKNPWSCSGPRSRSPPQRSRAPSARACAIASRLVFSCDSSTAGPICTEGSRPSPTLSERAPETSASVSLGAMRGVATTREVAVQRRGRLPDGDREGEVPRCDERHRTYRLPEREHERLPRLARERLAVGAEALARVELEQVEALHHLAPRLRQRLAFLPAQRLGEQIDLRLEDLVRASEDAPALRPRRAGPVGERLRRGVHRRLGVGGSAPRP